MGALPPRQPQRCPPTGKKKLRWELSLPRSALHHLLAERSGHGDFQLYHERFRHENPERLCPCGGVVHRFHRRACPARKGLVNWPPHRAVGKRHLWRIEETQRLWAASLGVTQQVVDEGRVPVWSTPPPPPAPPARRRPPDPPLDRATAGMTAGTTWGFHESPGKPLPPLQEEAEQEAR